jgi:hypothetical protein
MARHLKRPLKQTEHVHHKNRDNTDNRINNLELVNAHTHVLISRLEQRVDQLEAILTAHAIPFPRKYSLKSAS